MAATGFLHSMCRKTKLCKYFSHGRCTRQQNCEFAHSFDELRPVPDLSCTKVCPNLVQTGRCDDQTCGYAHQRGQLRRVRLSTTGPKPCRRRQLARGKLHEEALDEDVSTSTDLPLSRQSTDCVSQDGSSSSNQGDQKPSKPPPGCDWGVRFHKTTLCSFFQEGKCSRGEQCHFAHGEEELRHAPDLSQTKLCRRVVKGGSCQDPKCRYAHSLAELRSAAQSDEVEPPMESQPQWRPPQEMDTRVCVKNTFLTFEDEEPTILPPRFKTQPDMLATMDHEAQDSASASSEQTSEDSQVEGSSRSTTPHQAKSPEVVANFSDLLVKNTFLTIEEPSDIRLPTRAKSSPQLWVETDEDETPFDSVELPLALPPVVTLSRPSSKTTVVPVCALQQVSPLPEKPLLLVKELEISMPSQAKAAGLAD